MRTDGGIGGAGGEVMMTMRIVRRIVRRRGERVWEVSITKTSTSSSCVLFSHYLFLEHFKLADEDFLL